MLRDAMSKVVIHTCTPSKILSRNGKILQF